MKRIIICCDGTWNTPESKYVTNVTITSRALRPRGRHGEDQVVFYDWGVGTGNKVDAVKGGAFGKGIDKNIRDAYRFLVHNYAPGDEVVFFGFSRGAYTVRSTIGLLRNCGVLKKKHAGRIQDAYEMYRSDQGPDVTTARKFRADYSQKFKIKFLGVWDTVGALGIPLGIFGRSNERKFGFHDTTVSSIIENAYHALAIDEKRKPFAPTIWKTKSDRENTEQRWFAGVHSDIGGGYKDAGLSNLALKWMLNKAHGCGLAFDQRYLRDVMAENSKVRLHNSFSKPYKLLGKNIREIGVTNHDEALHPSVRRHYGDNSRYRPENLIRYLRF